MKNGCRIAGAAYAHPPLIPAAPKRTIAWTTRGTGKGGSDGHCRLDIPRLPHCRSRGAVLVDDAVNEARFDAFADAYVVAVLAAVTDLGPYLCGKTVEVFALDSALIMLAMVQDKGMESIEHYTLNRVAFPRVAETLGIEPTTKALQRYLEG